LNPASSWEWLVLIGYRASGKSTLGRALAQALNLEFYDQDDLVESRYSMTIPQIFQIYGEQEFRERESQVLFHLPRKSLVLSCGGGVVEREENMRFLKGRSKILFINTPKETLVNRRVGDDRPELHGAGTVIEEMNTVYPRRIPLYYKWADLVLGSSELEECLQALEEK